MANDIPFAVNRLSGKIGKKKSNATHEHNGIYCERCQSTKENIGQGATYCRGLDQDKEVRSRCRRKVR